MRLPNAGEFIRGLMWLKHITTVVGIGLVLSTFMPAPAVAENFRRGQELYGDHCDACHDSLTHPGKEQKVKSLSELRKRIASWADHTGQYWGNSEIDDVLYYLNKSYYHFEEKAL